MSKQNRKKKNKEAAPQIKTIRGVTSTGFAFEITKERLENYELLEAISEVDTNPAVLPKVVQLMLGNKSEDLKNHVRTATGIVPLDKMGAEISEIFSSQNQLKK
jgi:putative uncharacterized protein 47|nr:MAG TPA: hypothetical protein [Caudoviricetes sp.]